jgi:serine O-acetyltransferase
VRPCACACAQRGASVQCLLTHAPNAPPQKREPFLASFLYSTVLAHGSLQACVASFLAEKLSCPVLPATQLFQSFTAAYAADASLVAACHADLQAVVDRDPACRNYIQCVLFFKGFQALQAHRLAHHLWTRDRKPLALGLQSRVSERMQVDIHPGAVIGPGLMLDHATGVVIGETAVVGTNCSFLHKVTLGGTGVTAGDRHPKIGDGVLIGAGVSVLGPVRVGNGVKIGAGSVLLQDVPDRCTAVGVPARVIARPSEAPDAAGSSGDAEPAILMDQMVSDDDISHWAYII